MTTIFIALESLLFVFLVIKLKIDKIAFFRENEVSEDDFEYILNALTYKFLPESTDVIK